MRCLALAQAWRDRGGAAVFVSRLDVPALGERLRSEGIDLRPAPEASGGVGDAAETAALAREAGASWVVLDGPQFGAPEHRAIRARGIRVLAVNDMGRPDGCEADLVLNQNLHADPEMYRGAAAHTQLLLGTRYVLLRREFRDRVARKRRTEPRVESILVTLGGADAANHTAKVLRAVERADVERAAVTVVVGGGNVHAGEIEAAARRSRLPVTVRRNVSDMADLMASADLAVTAGGTTVWELAFLGVPALVGTVAPVEDLLADGLARHGLFVRLGAFESCGEDDLADAVSRLARDEGARAEMTRCGQALVDGGGCVRVLERMTGGGGGAHG